MSIFDIQQVAALTAARFDMDTDAAAGAVAEYIRQIEATGEDITGDAITADQADFILGAIAADRDTTPPSLLDDVADAAEKVTGIEQDMAEAVADRDAAIRAAVQGGHSITEVAAAARVSRERVYQIRDGRR